MSDLTRSLEPRHENLHAGWWAHEPNTVPTGVAMFAEDHAIRRGERSNNIVHWSEFDRGEHFAALEVPDLSVEDVRRFFRLVQGSIRLGRPWGRWVVERRPGSRECAGLHGEGTGVPRTIAVVGAPSGAGACGVGQERAPEALRAAGLILHLGRAGFGRDCI
jgi:hypothetical protein